MKAKSKKYILIAVFIIVSIFSVTLIGFLNTLVQNAGEFAPNYLSYMEEPSKIYIASASTSKVIADQTYQRQNGREITKGTDLLCLQVSLRNDYSIENPPPASSNIPVAPVDGTAYLCLSITLYNKDGTVTATILSPSDFAVTSPNQIGLMIPSGQTKQINLMLAANNVNINRFEVNLIFLGDSIQS